MSQAQLNLSPNELDATPPDKLPERLSNWVAVDLEHKGLGRAAQACGISVADETQTAYLPFAHAEGVQHEATNVRAWAKENLAGKDLIFRAAKNDIEVLRRWGVDLEALGARPHEVQHCAALLDDHRRTFTLDELMEDRLGRGKVKIPFNPETIWQQPPSRVAEYARGDALGTRELWFNYLPDIQKESLEPVLKLEDDLLYCTLSMERVGFPLDIPKLERWDAELQGEYQKRLLEIHRLTGLHVNPNSGPYLTRLFKKLGLGHSGFTTAKGKESFTEEALESFAGHWSGKDKNRTWVVDVPAVQLALEARQLESLRDKYTSKYLRGNIGGILYYQLHQLRADEGGTITGRYASSGIVLQNAQMGGNIQQVPKPDKQSPVTLPWIIRELFLPGRGQLLLDADASQIEFRLMVHYTKSERLIKAYLDNPDQDFHQLVTDQVLNNIMSRTLAKNFNFMKIYGGGVGKVMKMTGLDEVEATEMDQKYRRLFPEAGELLDNATRVAERRGYVRTFIGRRRRYLPGDRFYSALNSVLQGTAADLMKLALLALYNERTTLGIILRATVHDELLADVNSPEKAILVNELLNEQRLPIRVPILWDTKIGSCWGQNTKPSEFRLTRGDKEVREAEGFLNP